MVNHPNRSKHHPADNIYRGFKYRVYAWGDGFSWDVYGMSDLHPIKSGFTKRQSGSEDEAVSHIDGLKRAANVALGT